ncbi:bifunctional 4-hydroxy-2-oxoglutarate aldolase/2-dehydro-3-deoxy-phosphogluconate aldolase [Capilliphycus salinus ALCB114379]|uniref:bifunctional 4-hydroxy-2-oxoglutarate aldolase/2-dehydro-3-deoxy-phosphogluconate aldolase n=1 Tax=Capilliphycus salinus TaxID=2768948 RepID=UPI0039A451ED
MKPEDWRELLTKNRVIAVIRSPNLELGTQMAASIANGGIRLIEITWNSDRPTELISKLCSQLPNCIIGAGTLLTKEDINQAVDCGAEFLFTPHTNPALIEQAKSLKIPIIPGAFSPTEIVNAWQAGASCVKVFPISTLGGVAYIKNLRGPLGEIPLIPTGGVTLENARAFIEAGAIAVGLSSQLFPPSLLREQNWKAIADGAQILTQHLRKI